jgi:hypothetical protein
MQYFLFLVGSFLNTAAQMPLNSSFRRHEEETYEVDILLSHKEFHPGKKVSGTQLVWIRTMILM